MRRYTHCVSCGAAKKPNSNCWCPACDKVKRTQYDQCVRCGASKRRNRLNICPTCQAKARRVRSAPILDAFFEKGCVVCGEKDRVVLDAHHHPEPKKGRKTQGLATMTVASLKRELAGCVPVCANCHRRVHAGTVEIPE